jgi:hypothetical protein
MARATHPTGWSESSPFSKLHRVMRILRVVLVAWLLTDCGVVVGWLIGRPFGRQPLFLGGVVLGTLAILLAIRVLVRNRWFNPDRVRGGSIGGLCAFALAAPLAAMNLDSPLIPLLVMGLVGVGVVVGAGPRASVIVASDSL